MSFIIKKQKYFEEYSKIMVLKIVQVVIRKASKNSGT